MGGPGLIGGETKLLQSAIEAARLPCDADLSSMMNQFVGEVDPSILRDDFHEVAFDFIRSRFVSKFETPRKPHHMRINDYPSGNSVP